MKKWPYDKLSHALQKVEDQSDCGDPHEETQKKLDNIWNACGWNEADYNKEQERRYDDWFAKLPNHEKEEVLREEELLAEMCGPDPEEE